MTGSLPVAEADRPAGAPDSVVRPGLARRGGNADCATSRSLGRPRASVDALLANGVSNRTPTVAQRTMEHDLALDLVRPWEDHRLRRPRRQRWIGGLAAFRTGWRAGPWPGVFRVRGDAPAQGAGMTKIFISYRRADSKDMTERVCDRLRKLFGGRSVIQDLGQRWGGENYREKIREWIPQCDVTLAMIGERWLEPQPDTRMPRLHDPRDLLRQELELALNGGCRKGVPVLVHDARMPLVSDLPESLLPLCDISAVRVRGNPDFDSDMKQLLAVLPRPPVLRRVAPALLGTACLAVVAVTIWLIRPTDDQTPVAPSVQATVGRWNAKCGQLMLGLVDLQMPDAKRKTLADDFKHSCRYYLPSQEGDDVHATP